MSDYSPPVARRRRLPSLEFQLPPEHEIAETRRQRSWLARPLGVLMYVLAIMLAVDNDTFRRLEMRIAGPISGLVVGEHHVRYIGSSAFFHGSSARAFGMNLSAECTSALLLIPLLVMMGSFMIFTTLSLSRQVVAVLCGCALILAVNMLRVAGIAWATWEYGPTGYDYSHVFVGSAFSLVGFVGAMLIALWILVRSGRLRLRVPRHLKVLGGRHRAAE